MVKKKQAEEFEEMFGQRKGARKTRLNKNQAR